MTSNSIEFYAFISLPVSVILIGFQGHSDVRKMKPKQKVCFHENFIYPVELKRCIIVLYLDMMMNIQHFVTLT